MSSSNLGLCTRTCGYTLYRPRHCRVRSGRNTDGIIGEVGPGPAHPTKVKVKVKVKGTSLVTTLGRGPPWKSARPQGYRRNPRFAGYLNGITCPWTPSEHRVKFRLSLSFRNQIPALPICNPGTQRPVVGWVVHAARGLPGPRGPGSSETSRPYLFIVFTGRPGTDTEVPLTPCALRRRRRSACRRRSRTGDISVAASVDDAPLTGR
jgi:hypothetical protein